MGSVYRERVAFGGNGDLLVADVSNHRIRRIGSEGIVTTLAGNGDPAPPVEGAIASQSTAQFPQGLAGGTSRAAPVPVLRHHAGWTHYGQPIHIRV